jgi:signal transduction histidine kinase
MRKTIFSDVFIICAAVCFGAVVCVASVVIAVGVNEHKSSTLNVLQAVSSALSAGYGTAFDFEDSESLSFAASLTQTSIALCDREGVIRAQYGTLVARIPTEILSSLNVSDFSQFGQGGGMYGGPVFSYISKLPDGNFLQITAPPAAFYRFVISLVVSTILTALFGCAVIFAVLFYVTRHLLYPIEEMTAAAKRFEAGDFSRKIEISGDNELSFLAASLNDMAEAIELSEVNRANFISNVSHELKTPMTTIGGFADGMIDGTIPKEKYTEYLKIVSSEVRRLSRLVSNMLSLSTFDSGEKRLIVTRFDLVPIFIETAIFFEKQISDKKIDISGLDREPFFIEADEDLIRQVIFNLFENAVKFTDEDGEILVNMTESDTVTTVSIKNTGKGLMPEELAQVFDRFYKTDKSRGIDKTGVGLGLPIVSAIVKLHGGNLIAKSDPGSFTEFEFSLNKG